MMHSSMKLRAGLVIAGKYTLVKALARGGMGAVWVARHRDLDVEVAVKFMAPDLVESMEARGRFEREAKAAAKLRSQHVMQVLDCGVEKDTPYIVMELLQGESLHSRMRRGGRMSLPVASRIVSQICKALRTAHEAGLVHRDLKPANIFLARKDDEIVAKVLDFGIAKSSGTTDARAETASDVLLGSVHHMSPEQIRHSGMVTPQSDLWSVGVILYEMVTGVLPYPGKDFGDVLVRICTEPFVPASTVMPSLPAAVDAFFARALARFPDERFRTAGELADAFAALTEITAPLPAAWGAAMLGGAPALVAKGGAAPAGAPEPSLAPTPPAARKQVEINEQRPAASGPPPGRREQPASDPPGSLGSLPGVSSDLWRRPLPGANATPAQARRPWQGVVWAGAAVTALFVLGAVGAGALRQSKAARAAAVVSSASLSTAPSATSPLDEPPLPGPIGAWPTATVVEGPAPTVAAAPATSALHAEPPPARPARPAAQGTSPRPRPIATAPAVAASAPAKPPAAEPRPLDRPD